MQYFVLALFQLWTVQWEGIEHLVVYVIDVINFTCKYLAENYGNLKHYFWVLVNMDLV